MRFTLVWDFCIRAIFGGLLGCLILIFLPWYVSFCLSPSDVGKDRASHEGAVENDASFTVRKQPRLLFVGVMTAAHFLDTRALSVYQTWGQKVPGKASRSFVAIDRLIDRLIELLSYFYLIFVSTIRGFFCKFQNSCKLGCFFECCNIV